MQNVLPDSTLMVRHEDAVVREDADVNSMRHLRTTDTSKPERQPKQLLGYLFEALYRAAHHVRLRKHIKPAAGLLGQDVGQRAQRAYRDCA